MFTGKVYNIAKLFPALKAFLYKELTNDASASKNPEMNRLISLGHAGTNEDLSALNIRRPEIFGVFFLENLVVEKKTAPDDQRHQETHLSEWISLEEMRGAAAARCLAGSVILQKNCRNTVHSKKSSLKVGFEIYFCAVQDSMQTASCVVPR